MAVEGTSSSTNCRPAGFGLDGSTWELESVNTLRVELADVSELEAQKAHNIRKQRHLERKLLRQLTIWEAVRREVEQANAQTHKPPPDNKL
jgi:hypothetical protein